MEKEFNLSKERQKFFDECSGKFVTKGNEVILLEIKNTIEKQDKEFIKILKREIMYYEKLRPCEVIFEIDQLVGDKLK